MLNAGNFREDLYYRINVLPIECLLLGRRREDIRCWSRTSRAGDGKERLAKIFAESGGIVMTAIGRERSQLFDLVKHNVGHPG